MLTLQRQIQYLAMRELSGFEESGDFATSIWSWKEREFADRRLTRISRVLLGNLSVSYWLWSRLVLETWLLANSVSWLLDISIYSLLLFVDRRSLRKRAPCIVSVSLLVELMQCRQDFTFFDRYQRLYIYVYENIDTKILI